MTGTIDDPLKLQQALSSSVIVGGDTIYLRGGTYTGNFISYLNGLSSKILLTSYPEEQAIIDGSLLIRGSNLRIKDIQFLNSAFTTRETDSPSPSTLLIDDEGIGTEIINCVLHDAAGGILSSSENTLYYGNIIFNTGYKHSLNSYGHAFYTQNKLTTPKKHVNNIVFNNFGYGFHCYSSQNNLSSIWIENNIVFQSGVLYGWYYPNIHIGGGYGFANPTVLNNKTYYEGSLEFGANQIGYGEANTVTGAKINNNYFANKMSLRLTSCIPDEMTGNTFVSSTAEYIEGFESGEYATNTYSYPNTETNKTFITVNEYETTKAYIAIYNWAGDNTVNVDVSSFLSIGDDYKVTNVQDYFVDIVTGTVGATQTIDVDMRAISHTVSTPQGWTAPPTTFPTFGCFVVEKA
jgi:hypothetical protein